MRARLPKLCLLYLSLSTLLLAGCSQGVPLAKGGHAPKDNWQGQWRVINVWAEWCKPCWEEIPELNVFYATQIIWAFLPIMIAFVVMITWVVLGWLFRWPDDKTGTWNGVCGVDDS